MYVTYILLLTDYSKYYLVYASFYLYYVDSIIVAFNIFFFLPTKLLWWHRTGNISSIFSVFFILYS